MHAPAHDVTAAIIIVGVVSRVIGIIVVIVVVARPIESADEEPPPVVETTVVETAMLETVAGKATALDSRCANSCRTNSRGTKPVSYTHLTLPTIYSV